MAHIASICLMLSSNVVRAIGCYNPDVISKNSRVPSLHPQAKIFGIWVEKATESTEDFVEIISSGV